MNNVRPGHRRKNRVARGSLGANESPFRAAFKTGSFHDRARGVIAVLAAVGSHVALGVVAFMTPPQALPVPPKKEIPIIVAERPKPPPPPPQEPPPPQKAPPPQARHVHAPPPPTQAAKVVAAKSDGPADYSGFSMPEGDGDHYAGGETTHDGKGKEPVVEPPPPPKPPPPPPPSKARPASALEEEWSCAWPPGEQASDINSADVVVDIHVARNGLADDVDVVHSPNANFGEGAKACAFEQHYQPAWNDQGEPIADVIGHFSIHFVR